MSRAVEDDALPTVESLATEMADEGRIPDSPATWLMQRGHAHQHASVVADLARQILASRSGPVVTSHVAPAGAPRGLRAITPRRRPVRSDDPYLVVSDDHVRINAPAARTLRAGGERMQIMADDEARAVWFIGCEDGPWSVKAFAVESTASNLLALLGAWHVASGRYALERRVHAGLPALVFRPPAAP